INAIQSAFKTIIFAANTEQEISVFVTNRNEKRMNSVVDPLGDELGEHHGRFSMYGGIAKKLFPRGFERRMNFKFVVGREIFCGGIDITYIRSVANFQHAVRARQLKVEQTGYPLAVLFFITQRQNSRTK